MGRWDASISIICLAVGRFAYTNGVTIFDLVSSSSFGEYYKAETFPLRWDIFPKIYGNFYALSCFPQDNKD